MDHRSHSSARSNTPSWMVFTREWLANPLSVGAACPSSQKLARRMASFIPYGFRGTIVELGAGTGVVTAALLERGIDSDQLIVVERSFELGQFLKNRFPSLTVIHGDAVFLDDLLRRHLGNEFRGVDSVVSSLPLKSLPAATVQAIGRQLDRLLVSRGQFIQFTYDLRPDPSGPFPPLSKCASKIVWQNFPPARVDVFERRTPQVSFT